MIKGLDHWLTTPPEVSEPVCENCGVLRDDQYKQDGEYQENDYGPFPNFICLECGGEVTWE